jgi:hypothetical protein
LFHRCFAGYKKTLFNLHRCKVTSESPKCFTAKDNFPSETNGRTISAGAARDKKPSE